MRSGAIDFGIMWSAVVAPGCPQRWQVSPYVSRTRAVMALLFLVPHFVMWYPVKIRGGPL